MISDTLFRNTQSSSTTHQSSNSLPPRHAQITSIPPTLNLTSIPPWLIATTRKCDGNGIALGRQRSSNGRMSSGVHSMSQARLPDDKETSTSRNGLTPLSTRPHDLPHGRPNSYTKVSQTTSQSVHTGILNRVFTIFNNGITDSTTSNTYLVSPASSAVQRRPESSHRLAPSLKTTQSEHCYQQHFWGNFEQPSTAASTQCSKQPESSNNKGKRSAVIGRHQYDNRNFCARGRNNSKEGTETLQIKQSTVVLNTYSARLEVKLRVKIKSRFFSMEIEELKS